MSHLDEGTLHALLDGELELHEVREIQAHLGSCSACGTRLQSVKDVLAESDRLVGTLQFPGTPRRPAALEPEPLPPADEEMLSGVDATPPDEEPVSPRAEAPQGSRPPRRPERFPIAQPVYDEAPPVLLVPDDSAWAERRRRVILGMRWAALVLVAVGAGFLASEVRRTGGAAVVAPAARSAPAEAQTDTAGAILSQEEAATGAESTPAPLAAQSDRMLDSPPRARPDPAAQRKVAAAPTPQRASEAPPAAESPAADAGAASREPENRQAEERPTQNRPAARDQSPREEPGNESVDEAVAEDVREEAAAALLELDRQRRRERAAAATAELTRRAANTTRNDTGRATGAAAGTPTVAPAAAPPPPAPRTLEQRSGIYLRIGLDEAARQLGRPVHVLEGMQQQFMGLAQGSASPGADPARPVVRVVYQDSQGRMILLDQQRIRPGQSWGSSDTRWTIGEIGVALLGEPGPEVLRNLRPRVR